MTFIPNREELAWAAGFFDGEGTFYTPAGKKNTSLGVHIGQIDREVLDRFKHAVGGMGNVTGPYSQKENRKPVYQYGVKKFEHAQAIIGLLWPWLGQIKRLQAETAMKNFMAYFFFGGKPRKIGRAKQEICQKRYCSECRKTHLANYYAKKKNRLANAA